MAAFSSNIDITSGGTYAMDVTNGETSSKVATDLNGKFANIQELLRNGLPEVWTGSSLPDSLPNGKIVNYNNKLYYGSNKSQIADNSQVVNLQSQVSSLQNSVNNLVNNPKLYIQSGYISGNINYTFTQNTATSNSIYIPASFTTIGKIMYISFSVLSCNIKVTSNSSIPSNSNFSMRVIIGSCGHQILSGNYGYSTIYITSAYPTNTVELNNKSSSYSLLCGSSLTKINDIPSLSNIPDQPNPQNTDISYSDFVGLYCYTISHDNLSTFNIDLSGTMNINYVALCYN